MDNNINCRLQDIINHYGGNKSAFARLVGVSATVIENIVGLRKGKPSYDVLVKICANANVSAEWLLTGEGNMLKNEDLHIANPEVEERFTLCTDHKKDLQCVPLYEMDATAGLMALFDKNVRQIPISHLQIPDLPPVDGALYVRGDSMYPLLKAGDIVCYKEIPVSIDCIIWGEMYLLSFIIDQETFIAIKYIQQSDSENMIRLVSYNPHHSPKDIPANSVRALALVKASVRFNTMG